MRKAHLLPVLVSVLALAILAIPSIAAAHPGLAGVQPPAPFNRGQSALSGAPRASQGLTSHVYLPVLARPHTCRPNLPLPDPAGDVSAAYIDVTEVTSKLTGSTLEVTFHLRDLPATLPFHRPGLLPNQLEYAWRLFVDVDDNRQTGDNGAEYYMSAEHWVFAGNSPVTHPSRARYNGTSGTSSSRHPGGRSRKRN